MVLYDVNPANWQELQQFVGSILSECGFVTEIEKSIETVRGKISVDIYGERKESFESKIICECKNWETPIPQTVIHAFRTVINDSGADHGYIISKVGFQKGAYAAIEKSNVSIISWEEFHEKFKKEWLTQIIERNYKIGRKLMQLSFDVTSAIHKKLISFDETQMNEFYAQKESDFHFYTFKEHYLNLDNYEISDQQVNSSIDSFERKHSMGFSSYRHFFNTIMEECNNIIVEWKSILSNSNALTKE